MDGMGWMDPQKWADSREIDTFLEYAAQVREKADVFVLIGVGGSRPGDPGHGNPGGCGAFGRHIPGDYAGDPPGSRGLYPYF